VYVKTGTCDRLTVMGRFYNLIRTREVRKLYFVWKWLCANDITTPPNPLRSTFIILLVSLANVHNFIMRPLASGAGNTREFFFGGACQEPVPEFRLHNCKINVPSTCSRHFWRFIEPTIQGYNLMIYPYQESGITCHVLFPSRRRSFGGIIVFSKVRNKVQIIVEYQLNALKQENSMFIFERTLTE
jgi:hypothetical protein